MAVREIKGAYRDLNSRGRGTETFRKVWRNDAWQWISGYLPSGTIRAADRHASVTGDVETGEIVAEFSRALPDRRCDLDGIFVVTDNEKPLHQIEYRKPKLGWIAVTIDGNEIELPNPLTR